MGAVLPSCREVKAIIMRISDDAHIELSLRLFIQIEMSHIIESK